MIVKIKKLDPAAVLPTYAKPGDAGQDLTAISRVWDSVNDVWVYGTGLAFEIPAGHVGLLFPRSSIFKQDLSLSNSVGVIDAGYRGEVCFKFKVTVRYDGDNIDLNAISEKPYNVGDRIGQIIILPFPEVSFEEAGELSETERGAGGYGSTGN